jgi:phosphoglycolate phosphatase-like HAD superfamily hydrolase
MAAPLPGLFLFDIDGTLMRGGTAVHVEAFTHAYRTIYGLPLSLDGVPAAGRTDTWLLAEPLRRQGMPDEEIWARMPEAFAVMQAFAEEHVGDLHDRVLPGVPAVLDALRNRGQLLGLLTGNLSRIAVAKMRHAGLGGYFQTGAFGEESEVRAELVPVALAHAGQAAGAPIPAARAVLIGDTPMDVEAGKAHGTHTVGVATGQFDVQQLSDAGADLVLPSLDPSEPAVAALLGVIG